MPLYFAYGSNLSPAQMQRRCPGARAVGVARLDGWRFHITVRGGANVVRRRGATTYGVVWRLTPRHIAELDRWEGVAVGAYRRVRLPVVMDAVTDTKTGVAIEDMMAGRRRAVVSYVSPWQWPGRPRANYLTTAVLPGARAFALPDGYVAEIASWQPERIIGPQRTIYIGRRTRRATIPRPRESRVKPR